ncbi:unnamed protein product [Schistocephalus solidus]|uniref:Reverse transcriptase domain-containing protein n=1 Tax=Schistocephalus solidus TaxID=70667 RepID=A0A183TPP1_SCHSO|nr:unnamed protein product [Schistocephalus solidus]
MFFAMLMDAYGNVRPGIHITYRTDGHLLNSRRMQATTHTSITIVYGLLFADSYALHTPTDAGMPWNMDLIATGCSEFGLKINKNKTVNMQ